jgi:hypothetical protein
MIWQRTAVNEVESSEPARDEGLFGCCLKIVIKAFDRTKGQPYIPVPCSEEGVPFPAAGEVLLFDIVGLWRDVWAAVLCWLWHGTFSLHILGERD